MLSLYWLQGSMRRPKGCGLLSHPAPALESTRPLPHSFLLDYQ